MHRCNLTKHIIQNDFSVQPERVDVTDLYLSQYFSLYDQQLST